MKRFIVIECDTEFNPIFTYEVSREFTADDDPNKGVAYYRHPADHSLFMELLGPKFYGKLDALLINRSRIEDAAPIEPETMVERVERLQPLADIEHAGVSDDIVIFADARDEEPLL
jgi:hypothetical protein